MARLEDLKLSHRLFMKAYRYRSVGWWPGARLAKPLSEAKVALVSTAGLHKPVGELYPDPHLLAACRRREVPATLASDAHYPELVGRDFDRARALLRSAGYETVTVFEQREARQAPLG